MTGGRVDILDDATREVLGHCYGPTFSGTCPYTDRTGVVACAGHRIAPLAAGPGEWLRRVPPGTRRCPLAWDLEAAG